MLLKHNTAFSPAIAKWTANSKLMCSYIFEVGYVRYSTAYDKSASSWEGSSPNLLTSQPSYYVKYNQSSRDPGSLKCIATIITQGPTSQCFCHLLWRAQVTEGWPDTCIMQTSQSILPWTPTFTSLAILFFSISHCSSPLIFMFQYVYK